MRILKAKIKEKGANYLEYNEDINFVDYTKLACFFLDLANFGANIEKAVEEYKKLKGEENWMWKK